MTLYFKTLLLTILLIPIHGNAAPGVTHEADVCVYGGTASGVMAALAAERGGAKVILIEPSRWLGGMTGGGINELDWGKKEAVGGTAYRILTGENGDQNLKELKGKSTYSQVTREGLGNKEYRERFKQALNKQQIPVIYNHRLGEVVLNGKAIGTILLDHAPVDTTGCPIAKPLKKAAITVRAKVFIDCTYEGDLMAMSGVSYTWGRESRKNYDESLAGVRPSLWVYDIDPYKELGNPKSGLLTHIQDIKIGPEGSADKLTMGYCFRYEFDHTGMGIPFPKPKTYDPNDFELYRRAMKAGIDIYSWRSMHKLGVIHEAKAKPFIGRVNLSRCLWTHTVYGSNTNYPDGDWETRSKIWKEHQQFFLQRIHYIKTDPAVPQELKDKVMKLGFKRGVFDETQGWPNQFYVREARRMVSDYVVTQKDMEGKTNPKHSIGLASYGVDDWPYATIVEDGKVALQGGAFSILYLDKGKHNGIYEIPYEALIPKRGECPNLVVPVCLSASHIAMTSIRMEPVWMLLGESAGVASAISVKDGISVQDVPYNQLRMTLLKLGQKLDRPNDEKK